MATDYGGPDALPSLLAAAEQHDVGRVSVQTDGRAKNRFGFTVRDMVLPSGTDTQDPVHFEYYDVDGDQRTPVVLLLPIFNGQLIVTRYFARYFANQGWAAVVAVRERDMLEELSRPFRPTSRNIGTSSIGSSSSRSSTRAASVCSASASAPWTP
jgi:hypothetical protein